MVTLENLGKDEHKQCRHSKSCLSREILHFIYPEIYKQAKTFNIKELIIYDLQIATQALTESMVSFIENLSTSVEYLDLLWIFALLEFVLLSNSLYFFYEFRIQHILYASVIHFGFLYLLIHERRIFKK